MSLLMQMNRDKYSILKLGLVLFAIIFVVSVFKGINPIKPAGQIQEESKIIAGKFDESKFKSENEWKKILSPEQYHILRESGTETPFTGKLDKEKRKGTYYSAGCNQPIFRSEQKFNSGTGWPSFWAPITPEVLVLREDKDLGVTRIEVLDKCGGHLGHVFDDGPKPTGKRYCMNSEAMYFIPDKEQ